MVSAQFIEIIDAKDVLHIINSNQITSLTQGTGSAGGWGLLMAGGALIALTAEAGQELKAALMDQDVVRVPPGSGEVDTEPV
jgi:hypothetical protein